VTEAVTGWRCWRVEDSTLFNPFAPQDLDQSDRPWTPGVNRALCHAEEPRARRHGYRRPPDHGPVGDPRCSCGFYFAASLRTLKTAVHLVTTPSVLGGPRFVPDVIGQVRLSGQISGPDPKHAMRAGLAEITGPLLAAWLLNPGGLADRYRVDVVTSGLVRLQEWKRSAGPAVAWMRYQAAQQEWFRAGLESDWAAYQRDPRLLGRRLHRPR
jgi:hypothetical protein